MWLVLTVVLTVTVAVIVTRFNCNGGCDSATLGRGFNCGCDCISQVSVVVTVTVDMVVKGECDSKCTAVTVKRREHLKYIICSANSKIKM